MKVQFWFYGFARLQNTHTTTPLLFAVVSQANARSCVSTKVHVSHINNIMASTHYRLMTKMSTKLFLTCGISSALDGSEGHLIHEEIPKDIGDDEESSCADPDEDIDELDPFSDTED